MSNNCLCFGNISENCISRKREALKLPFFVVPLVLFSLIKKQKPEKLYHCSSFCFFSLVYTQLKPIARHAHTVPKPLQSGTFPERKQYRSSRTNPIAVNTSTVQRMVSDTLFALLLEFFIFSILSFCCFLRLAFPKCFLVSYSYIFT